MNIINYPLITSLVIWSIIFVLHKLYLKKYYKKNEFLKQNMLIYSYNRYYKFYKSKEGSFVEKLLIRIIEKVHTHSDIIQNIIRMSTTSKIVYNNSMDILILFYWICGSVLYLFYHQIVKLDWLIILFFISRVIAILFSKLQEITHLKRKDTTGASSFNRIFFLSSINFLELIIAFSWFYLYFNVASPTEFPLLLLLNTLRVFATLGISDTWNYTCWRQQLIIITQIMVFIVYFLVFFANILNIRFTTDKKVKNIITLKKMRGKRVKKY